MADRDKPAAPRARRAAHEILDFERPIEDLETKIGELEALSKDTDLNLNGEIRSLRMRLDRLIDDVFQNLSPWQQVQVARVPGRPLASDYIEGMCETFVELHGDRAFRDDPAVLTGLGSIEGRRVLIVAHRKGRDTKARLRCNFGSAHPEGYRKALRKMRLAEKFGIPVVSLINTPGAYPGIGAEERGQAWAIAENLREMFSLRVPIVCVVISEGGSGGALGIGIGDRILMLQHAYYSVISPEGCAAILWNDAKRAPEAAAALRLGARDLQDYGVIDEIVAEPVGAAHRDPSGTLERLKGRIVCHLEELERVPVERLLELRYQKFRAMGTLFSRASIPVASEPEVLEPAEDREEPGSGGEEAP